MGCSLKWKLKVHYKGKFMSVSNSFPLSHISTGYLVTECLNKAIIYIQVVNKCNYLEV